MKQPTLQEYWARKAQYPIEVAGVIHSFLPVSEELFLEQRVRFLLKSTELDTHSWGRHNNFDVVSWANPCVASMVITDEVTLKCDLLKTCFLKKRVFSQVTVSMVNTLSVFDKRHAIPYFPTASFTDFIGFLCAALKNSNLHIAGEMLSSSERGTLLKPELIPSVTHDQLFPYGYDFKRLRTTRHDGKQVFYKTPSAQVLHLLL